MSKQPTIFFFGMLISLGGFIQIVTSAVWSNIPDEKLGEMVFYMGQDIGELFYLFACRRLVKEFGIFVAVTEYLICLECIDMITVLWLDPLHVSLSKATGFIVASFVVLFRISKYRKK